jgi:hypothetical protein
MSSSNSKHADLRRTRSVGDEPTFSQNGFRISEENATIVVAKDTRSEQHSVGPAFNEPIPADEPNSPPRTTTPPPAVLHTSPAPAPTTTPVNHSNQDQTMQRSAQANASVIARLFLFFGYGPNASKVRRALVSFIWNLSWGLAQMVVIIAVLASSASKPSPTVPAANEWTACSRPLGVWSSLWLVRVIVACIVAYWTWTRDKTVTNRNSNENAELGQAPSSTAHSTRPEQNRPERNRPERVQLQQPSQPSSSPQTDNERLRHTTMFKRISLLSSLFSLTWFLTAHILLYSSLNTCRFSSPHIWWLVFGILCITYLMILEVIILALIVFVFAPVVFIVWNIFLLCIGRHPIQNPHMIKPDIGKLPKTLVDRIPLVMYIPPSPDAPPMEGPIRVPENAYSYPPKSPGDAKDAPTRKRFKFIKFKKPKPSKKSTTGIPTVAETSSNSREKTTEPGSWEDNWDTEGYPFVVLDDNRAACAICLLDFEEPKRLHPAPDTQTEAGAPLESKAGETTSQTVEVISEEERENDVLRLEDAGEGAQPLRLLKCGHVFHKTCLDPWLTDVSGRCPVCQRPVEIPGPEKKKRRPT